MNIRALSLLQASLILLCSCVKGRETRPTGGGGNHADFKIWYISADGSDSNSGISPSLARRTFDKVLTETSPGDIIKVMPGTYVYDGKSVLTMKNEHSGDKDRFLTIQAQDPENRPVFICGGQGVWNAVDINASWVILDGLEFRGYNDRLDSLQAYNIAHRYFVNNSDVNWTEAAQFNTNCISIGDKNGGITTHVTVRNCVIRDFPGCGVGATTCDYITFENNVIYNNSWFCMYACSGISIIHPTDCDSETGHKLFILNNLVYNNHCKIPWVSTSDFSLSDGNGIIMDINQYGDQRGIHKDSGPYKGRTLVANNISVNNGGSGIHSYKADHVDIVNNTAYCNGRKYPKNNYAEIFINQAKDCKVYNNIMIARKGAYCTLRPSDNTTVYSHNLYHGSHPVTGTGDKEGDPLVVKLSRDGATADFHLQAASPARGAGITESFVPDRDMDGVIRRGTVDCGALQYISK